MGSETPPGAVPCRYADGTWPRPGSGRGEPPTVPIQKAAARAQPGGGPGLRTGGRDGHLVAIAEANAAPGTDSLHGMRAGARPRQAVDPAGPPSATTYQRGRTGAWPALRGRRVRSRCGSGSLRGSAGGRALPGDPVRDLLVQSGAAAADFGPGADVGDLAMFAALTLVIWHRQVMDIISWVICRRMAPHREPPGPRRDCGSPSSPPCARQRITRHAPAHAGQHDGGRLPARHVAAGRG